MAASLHETARLDALARSRVVDTLREPEFDALVRLAAHVTRSPMAMISFVDRDRLWLKATYGLSVSELPRARSFCDAAIAQTAPFAVHDAARDTRFADYVLVASGAGVRSYAGAPLQDDDSALGTLAVLDTKPRSLSRDELDALEALAKQVIALLELRRLRDKRLLKTEALLMSATRISGIGCWQWNMHSGEIHWSNEMYEIFGLPRTVTPSLDAFRSRVHVEDRALVEARTLVALEGAMTEFPDYRVERPNGEVRVVQATAELERDASGRPLLLTGALLDVTERRQAEQQRKRMTMQVMHSQKLESLGVLAAGVAHDFNNLLVGILGNAELACADLTLSASTRELLERTTDAAVQAAALTRQLLAYTGRGHVEMTDLDLSEQTAATAELARSVLPSSVLLSSSLARRMPSIQADSEQLQQVTMNLLRNAAESYHDGLGEVCVRTYAAVVEHEQTHDLSMPGSLLPGRYAVLEVADQGQGMTSQTLERAFEPFFSTKFTGRGLGLAAVLGIARAHRAVLTVDSRPGGGSCFRVHFPVQDRQVSLSVPRPSEPPLSHALAGKTVLVVDHEPRVRHLERRVLQEHGAQVLEAQSGDEAVALFALHAHQVDVVLLDLVMPGLDAASTLRALRAVAPGIAVVIQSGYPEEEVSIRLHEIDRKLGFLQKPFSPKQLVARLTSTLSLSPRADASRP